MKKAIAIAAVAVLALPVLAFAAPRGLDAPAKDALTLDGGSISPSAFFFGAGFEQGEGFVLGPIEPQLGWTATGVNLPWASVSAALPFTGLRHLRLIRNPASGLGVQHLALGPNNAQPANQPSTVYCKINISNDQGADYDVISQAPSQAFTTWRVKFSFSDAVGTGPGTIFVLDNPGNVLQFVDTGVLWTPGVYKELRVDLDPAGTQIRYYYDGALIYTGAIFAGTSVEQVLFRTDNFQLAGETGDIDALSVQTLNEGPVAVRNVTWSQVKSLMR